MGMTGNLMANSMIRVLTPTRQTHRSVTEEGVFVTSKPSILVKGILQTPTRLLLNDVPVVVDASGRFYEVVTLNQSIKTIIQLKAPDLSPPAQYDLEVMYLPDFATVEAVGEILPEVTVKAPVTMPELPVSSSILSATDGWAERTMDPFILFLPKGATMEGDKMIVSTQSVTISGVAYDVQRMSINGELVSIKDKGRFAVQLSVPKTGMSLRVVAVHKTGHTTTKKWPVFYRSFVREPELEHVLHLDGISPTQSVIETGSDRWVLKGQLSQSGLLTINDLDVPLRANRSFVVPLRLLQAETVVRLSVLSSKGVYSRVLTVKKWPAQLTENPIESMPVDSDSLAHPVGSDQPITDSQDKMDLDWEWLSPVVGEMPKGVVVLTKPVVFIKARTRWTSVKVNQIPVPVSSKRLVTHKVTLKPNVTMLIEIEGMGDMGREIRHLKVCYQPMDVPQSGMKGASSIPIKPPSAQAKHPTAPISSRVNVVPSAHFPSYTATKITKKVSGDVPTQSVRTKVASVSKSFAMSDTPNGLTEQMKRFHTNSSSISEGERSKMVDQMMLTYKLMETGNERFYRKEYAKAVAAYEEARALMPRYPDIYVRLGSIYFRMKEWEKAEKMWSAALALDPQYPELKKFIAKARQAKSTPVVGKKMG